MTTFVIVCAALLLVTLVWLTLPLWRPRASVDVATTRKERRVSSIIVLLAVPALAAGMYSTLSNWDWKGAETAAAESNDVEGMLTQLEQKLKANPQDLQGWMLLGRSYAALGRYPRAVEAFQHAFDVSKGEDVEATVGLAEALALLDRSSLQGRAGELINEALSRAPNHPKALWYGGVAAMEAGNLRLARDRLQSLLAQGPPDQLRTILQQQVDDLNTQLGETGEGAPQQQAAAAGPHTIRVSVSIAPAIQQQLKGPTPLFILARDSASPGPPLAAQRRSSAEAPLTVELSEADAMMPTRTLAGATRVKVVARLSLSGAPQQRSGDFYGEADYEFGKDTGTLQIVIDRTVP